MKERLFYAISLVILMIFSYVQFREYIIPGYIVFFSFEEMVFTSKDVGLIWIPVVAHILLVSNTCLLFKTIKPSARLDVDSIFIFFIAGSIFSGIAVGSLLGLMYSFSDPAVSVIQGIIIGPVVIISISAILMPIIMILCVVNQNDTSK